MYNDVCVCARICACTGDTIKVEPQSKKKSVLAKFFQSK